MNFFNSHPIVAMKKIENSNEKAIEEVEILKNAYDTCKCTPWNFPYIGKLNCSSRFRH